MYNQTVCIYCTYPQWKHEHSKFNTCGSFEAKPLPIDEKEKFLPSRYTKDKETEIILECVLKGVKYATDIHKETSIPQHRVYYHLNKLRAKNQVERVTIEESQKTFSWYRWLPNKTAQEFLALEDD